MTAVALRGAPDTRTSALGYMNRPSPDASFEAMTIGTAVSGWATATANTDPEGSVAMWVTIVSCAESTAAEPTGKIPFLYVPVETTGEAIMEIRRRSGLTWEELGDLFDVSRRSVHHWANGKPVTARHDRTIRNMLAAIRHLDRGDRAGTRALLLTVDGAMGISTLDLLKNGRFDEAMGRVAGVRAPEPRHTSLSRTAWDSRRPPAPTLLLGAEQERPDIPASARVARPKRIPKTAG